tara:strand:+ start:170 stop:550 length:381 start_codon:yes stop_codon:yes gene_type:complete
MYEFAWFFAGALVYKFLAHLLRTGTSIIYLRKVQLHAVLLLAHAAEDISFIKRIKHSTLKESNISEEQIKLFKEADQELFESWKSAAISNMNSSLPPKLHAALTLENWEETLKILDTAYNKKRTGL